MRISFDLQDRALQYRLPAAVADTSAYKWRSSSKVSPARWTALAGAPVISRHSGFLVSLEAQASDLCVSHQQSTGSWGSGVMHEVDRASPSPTKDALDRPCWITQSIETKGEDSPVLGCRCLEWIGGWEGMRVQQTGQ